MSSNKIPTTTNRDRVARILNGTKPRTVAYYARRLGTTIEAAIRALRTARWTGRISYELVEGRVVGHVVADYYDGYGLL